MAKYIAQFFVFLEDSDDTEVSFFRALEAKDINELYRKIELLEKKFPIIFNEEWKLHDCWPIPDETEIEQMSDFLLTDKLIGWNKK